MKPVTAFRRITLKIGSALLVDPASGLRSAWLAAMAADIAMLRRAGADVLVVSSGAIALGRTVLDLGRGALRLMAAEGVVVEDCGHGVHARLAGALGLLSISQMPPGRRLAGSGAWLR